MIHVDAKPEPASFEANVRKKGLAYLKKKGIELDKPLPAKTVLEPYWQSCLYDLHQSYYGTCAYLCIFIERIIGGVSVDHYIAKSNRAGLAYEWSNYRLACATMNIRKRVYEDVLDPFDVKDGWFYLELVCGRIYPNPNLEDKMKNRVVATIERLGLDDAGVREMRARHYQEYCEKHYSAEFLKKRSPFVWYEAQRQGLL